MSNVKNELVHLIEQINDDDAEAILTFIKRFVPIPDDIATPEDLEAIELSRQQISNGDYVTFEEILKQHAITLD
jgi:hypothetical protein